MNSVRVTACIRARLPTGSAKKLKKLLIRFLYIKKIKFLSARFGARVKVLADTTAGEPVGAGVNFIATLYSTPYLVNSIKISLINFVEK